MRSSSPLIAATGIVLLSIFFLLDSWVEKKFVPPNFDDRFARLVENEKPDVICIGNSSLGQNVDKAVFTEELSRLAGRPMKASFIVRGGMHSAWYYLILKNQIAKTSARDVPVVFFDAEDYYLKPDAKTATGGKSEIEIKKTMSPSEDIFMHKIGANRLYFARGFPHIYSQRYQYKRWMIAEFVVPFLRFSGVIDHLRKPRWATRNELVMRWVTQRTLTGQNFRRGYVKHSSLNNLSRVSLEQKNFIEAVERSFIPELLKYNDRFNIRFLLSSSNPKDKDLKRYLKRYAQKLDAYLRAHESFLIDMNSRPELQDASLMHDPRHFTKGYPRNLNSKLVAEEFVNHEVVVVRPPTTISQVETGVIPS